MLKQPIEQKPQMNLSKLYDSERCQLISIIKTGKKETPGELHFKGLPTAIGGGTKVRAIEDGVVMYVGRCYDTHSRDRWRGLIVSVQGRNGTIVSYERLSIATAKEGEYIRAGEPIGYEGNTGRGREIYLAMRFERNGRLVDGLEYLGIPEKLQEFRNVSESAEELVCKVCRFDSKERYSIRSLPCADSIWDKVRAAFESRRT